MINNELNKISIEPDKTFYKRNFILIKSSIIALLIVFLLIPLLSINYLVKQRKESQQEAVKEVSSKWCGRQTVVGPIITIPYFELIENKDSSKTKTKLVKYIHILPENLDITGEIFPQKRYRGIYEVIVYTSKLKFKGDFKFLESKNLKIPKENLMLEDAYVSLGLTDLKGIDDEVKFQFNNQNYTFAPGIVTEEILETGINTKINISPNDSSNSNYKFSFDLALKGSEDIYFVPVGKITNINLNSSWDSPKFEGAYLPTERKVTAEGFNAKWKVLYYNRNFPQQWLGSSFNFKGVNSGELINTSYNSVESKPAEGISNSVSSLVGVILMLPVNNYAQATRSINYGFLIIILTFIFYFFIELFSKKEVHPIHYILIGFALCIFYSLLLSISEHLNYSWAYLISSVMTIGLIYLYTKSIIKENRFALMVGCALIILYGFIYTIIQMEDYALLMGNIGLFIVLALLMFTSRKINWFNIQMKSE